MIDLISKFVGGTRKVAHWSQSGGARSWLLHFRPWTQENSKSLSRSAFDGSSKSFLFNFGRPDSTEFKGSSKWILKFFLRQVQYVRGPFITHITRYVLSAGDVPARNGWLHRKCSNYSQVSYQWILSRWQVHGKKMADEERLYYTDNDCVGSFSKETHIL